MRDVKAGSHDAILRDEKTLRSALAGFVDGRQVGVQVLDHEEELAQDQAVVLLRAWLLRAGQLTPPLEVSERGDQGITSPGGARHASVSRPPPS